MKFGGQILKPFKTPEEWLALIAELGYSAVYFPLDHKAADCDIDAYMSAAYENGLMIAEIGAWSNPMSPNKTEAHNAMENCKKQLALAEHVGAACCVNISGSRGNRWDGPHPDNFTKETFNKIVETVQEIIDAVNPKRTFYTLELMPWMYPYNADTYLELIRAIDHPRFAVHLDPVNIINSPLDYFNNGAIIRECFDKLGPYIKSCHAKDIFLEDGLTVHLNEKRPGLGALDYRTYLDCLRKLDDVPLMMEHIQEHDEVVQAAKFIRSLEASL